MADYFQLPKKPEPFKDIPCKPVLKVNVGEHGYTGEVTAYKLPDGRGVIIMAADAETLDAVAHALQPKSAPHPLNRDWIYTATLMSKGEITVSELPIDDEEL